MNKMVSAKYLIKIIYSRLIESLTSKCVSETVEHRIHFENCCFFPQVVKLVG